MKIGFVISDLGPTQESFALINSANKVSGAKPQADPIIFYENMIVPSLTVNFATMQLIDGFSYQGPMVTTSLINTQRILGFAGPTHRLFYVWDLEWLRIRNKSYDELSSIYNNPKIELVARSAHHAKVIERCWDKPVKGIVDNFNIMEFLKLCT